MITSIDALFPFIFQLPPTKNRLLEAIFKKQKSEGQNATISVANCLIILTPSDGAKVARHITFTITKISFRVFRQLECVQKY